MDNSAELTACEFTSSCDFFAETMASVPQLSEVMIEKYCRNDFVQCARHAYAKVHGSDNVPEDLFPNTSLD